MAHDEWRVEVDLDDEAHGHPLRERLRALDLDDEVQARLGDRVIVTRDGPQHFVYTESAESAAEAEQVVREQLAADDLTAEVRVTRWNPAERIWQHSDAPATAGSSESAQEPRGAADEGVPHPLFVYIESYEPEFMRDLGV